MSSMQWGSGQQCRVNELLFETALAHIEWSAMVLMHIHDELHERRLPIVRPWPTA